jgi:hypothetical protein
MLDFTKWLFIQQNSLLVHPAEIMEEGKALLSGMKHSILKMAVQFEFQVMYVC